MTIKARLTAQDLWKLGEGDTRRELVNGEIREMAPAGGVHGRVAGRICHRLVEHVDRHGGGEVLVGDVGFVLDLPHDPERVRAPDVAFVTTARLPEGRLPAEFIRGAPDLAVEVLSPSDSPVDVQQKVRDYLIGLDQSEEGRKKLEPTKYEGFAAYPEADMLAIGKWLGLPPGQTLAAKP